MDVVTKKVYDLPYVKLLSNLKGYKSMSIKKIIKKPVSGMKYPYVGKYKSNKYMGFYILFVSNKKGCVVFDLDDDYKVGHFCDCWEENHFTPVEATIEFGV